MLGSELFFVVETVDYTCESFSGHVLPNIKCYLGFNWPKIALICKEFSGFIDGGKRHSVSTMEHKFDILFEAKRCSFSYQAFFSKCHRLNILLWKVIPICFSLPIQIKL